eukprot:TRINITY_DN6936_c0_g1_i1.p1 TRINITY_DN6936_c0_g1~~TRINITY_DN6936_c0_g1_i1.p1  ORF type:complete len:426 (+),score=58.13 TRINITY_DN6936_c0_g1_i1:1042-2319(+)
MGVQQSRGKVDQVTEEEIHALFSVEHMKDVERDKFVPHVLSSYSILSKDDADRKTVMEAISKFSQDSPLFFDPKMDKAVACFLGNVLGDAFGAPTEFSKIRYGKTEYSDFNNDIWKKVHYNRFSLKPGQWTDDASMMLCLADSLLVCKGFDGKDMRLRFLNWWQLGYNNAFGWDDERKTGSQSASSVGLGGNISASMAEFMTKQAEFTEAGDTRTSGNGSVMRNGAVPVFYANEGDIKGAMACAYNQSRTTHQGEEAAECCRLLTFVTMKFIAGEKKEFLENLGEEFKTELYSVSCLAKSLHEQRNKENADLALNDRNWNWKDPEFRYSKSRSTKQPGYIGSYAMDALCMALHCIWTTNSFQEALVKCANLRGDADSVCAVLGQMAGALYGTQGIPYSWITTILKWDPDCNIPLRAYKLFTHNDF